MAFVKGDNERNEFFEKNKQIVIYDEQAGRTGERTNNLRDELIRGRTPSDEKKLCASLHQYNEIAVTDIFNKKGKCCNLRCPDSDFYLFFYTMLLILYSSAIETLICRRDRQIPPLHFSTVQMLRIFHSYILIQNIFIQLY